MTTPPPPIRWGGFINQGSTCYLNSVIQVLYHLPLFRKKMYEIKSKDKLVMALQSLFFRLGSGEQNISTTELTSAFGWGGGQVSVQQDVHELLQKLLDCLEKQIKGSSTENFIRNMFSGELVYRSKPVDEKIPYLSDRLEQFYDLEVLVKGCKDFEESLETLSKPEKIEGVSIELTAGATSTKVNIERSLRLLNLPPVLMIHPNRVTFDTATYELRTIDSMWSFPEAYDLQHYLVEKSSLKLDAESRAKLSEHPLSVRVSGNNYILHAILIHAGTTTMGHYYAYIFLEGQWICFNDEQVSVTTREIVFKSAFGGSDSRNGHYETERASVLIYINESCKEEVLNEKDIVIPQHVIAQKKIAIPYHLCGFESPGLASVDPETLITPSLPYEFTLEELKASISSSIQKDASLLHLFIVEHVGQFVFFPLEDLERFRKQDLRNVHVVVVHDNLNCLIRAVDREKWFASAKFVAEFIRNKNKGFYLQDKKSGKFRALKEEDIDGEASAYFFAEREEDLTDAAAVGTFSAKDSRARDVVFLPSVCNGLWDYKSRFICMEKRLFLGSLQERIRSVFEPTTLANRIYFIRSSESHIPFPPLLQHPDSREENANMRKALLENNSRTLFYTILPASYETLNLDITVVLNLGWKLQPRIFLQRRQTMVSLPLILTEIRKQIWDVLPSNLKKRLESLDNGNDFHEKVKTVARLLKTTTGAKVEEVCGEEEGADQMLYIVDPCPPQTSDFSSLPVYFRASQQQKSFIGLPTFIQICNTLEETGKVVLERVWKRLRVPDEKVKTDGARWLLWLETAEKKSLKVDLKNTLKSTIPVGEHITRIVIERPLIKELDGSVPEKDVEALVISS